MSLAVYIGQIDGIPHLSVPAARGMSVMSEFSSVEEDEDDHIEPTSGKYLFLSECPDAVVSCFLKAWKVSGIFALQISPFCVLV